MDRFRNVPGEMDRLAADLDEAASKLDSTGRAPMANAGESIALVAEAVARISEAAVGVSGGLHKAADDVRACRDEYLRNDQQAADGMPTPPGR